MRSKSTFSVCVFLRSVSSAECCGLYQFFTLTSINRIQIAKQNKCSHPVLEGGKYLGGIGWLASGPESNLQSALSTSAYIVFDMTISEWAMCW